MKIFLKTWGCQSNIADSEQLLGLLKQKGHKIVDSLEKSDIIILNTCSVKLPTQNSELHFIKTIPKNKKLFVGGCLTKTLNLRKYSSNISALFDTNSLLKVPDIIDAPKDLFSDKKEKRINLSRIRKNKDTAIINISQGCLGNCDFCSTKLARGNLKSYRIRDIKREFQKALRAGCKKIYLSSQDNACYGFDINTNLTELLNELLTVKGDYFIRIGMMNPGDALKIIDKLVKIYKNKKIMKFIHIPVQSGSDKLLKNMKRAYSVKDFKFIVKELRKAIPNITIATDVIIGHPLEKPEDFILTCNLIKELKPEVLNISKFSSRPKTLASKLKQLDSETIDERSKKISLLNKQIKNRLA